MYLSEGVGPLEEGTDVVDNVVAEGARQEAESSEAVVPVDTLLLALEILRRVTGDGVNEVAGGDSLQHEALIAGAREILLDGIEEEGIES